MYGKTRQYQSDLIKDLMLKMAETYEKIFPQSHQDTKSNNLDGVENCVCKNLHVELFTSLADDSENQENRLLASNIDKFKSFRLPRHLELKQSRISEERLQ